MTEQDNDALADPFSSSAQESIGTGWTLMLGAALALGAIGAALPAMLLSWLLFTVLTVGVVAEALEQSGGLVPTTFGGGYWLAAIADITLVSWCFIRMALKHPAPWRPLEYLIVAYALLLWGVLPADLAGALDAPDVLTTFALLGANWLIEYLLPLAMLVLLARGLRVSWRAGRKSLQAAERVSGLSVILGLSGLSVAGALVAAGAEGYFDTQAPTSNELDLLEFDDIEGERLSMVELSAEIGPPVAADTTAPSVESSRFYECSEALNAAGQEPPMLQQAIQHLVGRGLIPADAQDIAMDTLLRVCLRHARAPIDDVSRYYWRAIHNGRKRLYARTSRYGDDSYDEYTADSPSPAEEAALREEIEALTRALETLKPQDRHVLELRYGESLEYSEIATRLDESSATVRKRVERATERLRQAFWTEVGAL